MLGVVAPCLCPQLGALWNDAGVIHFAESESANGAAIKGASRTHGLSAAALTLHGRLAASATRL